MRVVAAVDKFRGTATAAEVAAAIGHACWELGHDCVEIAVADGGEGILDALGGPNRTTTVTGPLGDPVEAPWRLHRRVAVIEMALASGLSLAGGAESNGDSANPAISADDLAQALRHNGIIDTEGYRKLGRNQLRIGLWPAIPRGDIEALTACLDYLIAAF